MKRMALSLFFALSSAPGFAAPPGSPLDAGLLEGDIVLYEARSDESGGAARARMLVHAPAEAIWNVIISCEAAFTYVKGLEFCEIMEDEGGRALVRQVADPSWIVPKMDYVFESVRDPYREIRFQRISGDLDILEGYWIFTPVPEGLLVDYEARVKPSIPAPRWLVRYTVKRSMPDLLACIRYLSGGSGSSRQEAADRGRCP
jgi:hypothetical protein